MPKIAGGKLTDKQSCFIDEYLVDLNATQAAIRSGYSEKTAKVIGCENLTKPYIQEIIAERQKIRAAETKINQEWVITKLVENANVSMTNEMVKSPDGAPSESFTHNPSAANKALELIGKHVGMFTDKLDINGVVSVQIDRDDSGL